MHLKYIQFALKYEQKVFIPFSLEKKINKKKNLNLISTFLINIESLGYTMDWDVIEKLFSLKQDELIKLLNKIENVLKIMVGADVEYEPMYPNFPKQVMEMDQSQLYLNAMFHYIGDWFGVRIMPIYDKEKRPKLKENHDLKIIKLADFNIIHDIFQNMMSSKLALSDDNKNDLTIYLGDFLRIPAEIPIKENMVFVCNFFMKHPEVLHTMIKTATDVLRLAVALSHGDISLREKTFFKKFNRKERKLILSLLEKCLNKQEDMYRYKGEWIRLGEILHPGEKKYQSKFPKSNMAFYLLRNNSKIRTFNSRVNAYIKNDPKKAISLLKTRPSEFARRIDKLLRVILPIDVSYLLDNFFSILNDIPTTILLQLDSYFENRMTGSEFRIFFPKGKISKIYAIENNLPNLNKNIYLSIIQEIRKVLNKKFIELNLFADYKRIYIDPELKNHNIPFALRSTNESLYNYTRGSSIPLSKNGNDTVRFFIHWRNIRYSRVDVDLSALGLDTDYNRVDHISYMNLKSSDFGYHSGDITSAPDGASEFIDINIKRLTTLFKEDNSNIRYIVMVINSYTQQPFIEIPECFAGWMMRKDVNSGEIFEPKTVKNKSLVTSNTKISIPIIIDIFKNKVYWADLSLTNHPNYNNNVINNQSSLSLMTRAIIEMKKPTLYHLFYLHVNKTLTKIVEDKKTADFIITKDTYKLHEINAKFL